MNHVIFEQPTKEDDLEDTYRAEENKIKHLDLKAEDLTTLIENNFD